MTIQKPSFLSFRNLLFQWKQQAITFLPSCGSFHSYARVWRKFKGLVYNNEGRSGQLEFASKVAPGELQSVFPSSENTKKVGKNVTMELTSKLHITCLLPWRQVQFVLVSHFCVKFGYLIECRGSKNDWITHAHTKMKFKLIRVRFFLTMALLSVFWANCWFVYKIGQF